MARLPINGGDPENWGAVLNEFLLVGHNPDGTVKQQVGPQGPVGPAGPEGNSAVYNFVSVEARDDQLSSAHPGTLAYTPETGVFMYYGSFWAPLPGTEVATISATANQSIPHTGYYVVTLQNNVYLPFGQTRTTDLDRYVLPFTGRYEVTGHFAFNNAASGYRYGTLFFFKGGVSQTVIGAHTALVANTGFVTGDTTGSVSADAGDYVQLAVAQSSGAALNTAVSGAAVCSMRVKYLGITV